MSDVEIAPRSGPRRQLLQRGDEDPRRAAMPARALRAEEVLERTALTGREWRAVGELAKAKLDFEPLAMRSYVGPIVAERLIQLGIAEVGPSAPRFNRAAFPIGYRLSRLGRMILARGRRPPEAR